MANKEINLLLRFRTGHANAITQAACGQIRRAPRNERPAIADRAVRRLKSECIRVVPV